jgi:HEAT repeat protein
VNAAARDAAAAAFTNAVRSPLEAQVRVTLERHAGARLGSVRLAAVRCLAVGDPACDATLAARAIVDADDRVRAAAVEGLGRSGTPEARAALEKAARDPSPSVRGLAAWALEKTRSH